MALRIREAGPDDAPLLRELGLRTYREHFSALWSEAGMRAFLDRDFAPESLVESLSAPARSSWWLACEEDEAVGFAKLNWHSLLPGGAADGRGAALQKIYFLARCAGRGIGKRLLEEVEARARHREAPFLWLDVLKSNAGAQRFYEREGFAVCAEIPFATDLREIGMFVMRKPLA
jgi:diamine N-acetyltransferase